METMINLHQRLPLCLAGYVSLGLTRKQNEALSSACPCLLQKMERNIHVDRSSMIVV